jgi:general secretion pathway protein G
MRDTNKIIAGFTLIELMVVIVILGILSAVIAPRIPSFTRKAKEGKTKGNLATLRSTINIYYADNEGIYPTDTLGCLAPKYLRKTPDCDLPPYHPKNNTVVAGSGIGDSDMGHWQYNRNITGTHWGNIWIECQHQDSSGAHWSSY